MRIRPQDYWFIDNVVLKNNSHGKVFGIFHKNGVGENKILKIRRTLQEGRWGIEIPTGKSYSENGVEYDIKKTEDLIVQKKELLKQRNEMIGYVHPIKQAILDKKKAKKEAVVKKKK
jgi:hypothetical protein